MMNRIKALAYDFARKNVSKLVAPFVVAFAAWSAAKLGLDLPPEFAAYVTDAASMFAAACAVSAVGAVERAIARKTNPDNTAK